MEKVRFCLADLFDCGQVAIFYRVSESISLLLDVGASILSPLLDMCQKGEKH